MEKEQAQIIVEKSLIDGFTSLASALNWFWPTGLGKHKFCLPIQESTLLTYIGANFLKRDFYVFNEMRFEKTSGALDMFAINVEKSIAVYIEAKGSVYATEQKSLQIKNNIERMCEQNCRIDQDHEFGFRYKQENFKHQFAVIVTTCYENNIRNWWHGEETTRPNGTHAVTWKETHELLKNSLSRWSIPLRSTVWNENKVPNTCYGLYAMYCRSQAGLSV